MTETLVPLARAYGADSPLAQLLQMAQAADDVPTEAEQRDDAETTAAHHVYNEYTETLGMVIDAEDWRGYPAVRADGLRSWEASAVAWLDGGLWLHHTLHISEDGARDVLTLIVPCTCGRGYVDIQVDTETDLLAILAELGPTGGRSVHEVGPLGCASVRPVAPLGGWQR
ncbi:hypothetical protein [Streptomyces sp. NPDC004589]|uniref:hypothetical protein n=1 Tax=Streptomyces sp. NPDC004589 TaxID=3154553 RepID=UPI0033B108CE